MSDYLFIESPVSVLSGDAARVALKSTNDAAYLTEGKGVLSVPLERWQAAQEYERATWLEHGLMLTEDRNAEHAVKFTNYQSLPENLGNAIELGCGPFTNIIRIISGRKSKSLTLLDPLIDKYRSHPHCTYKDHAIYGHFVETVSQPIESFDRHKWITDSGRMAYTEGYDTLVMVNVLSHCQSAEAVFEWINAHLKVGGYLVFHEPARDIDVHTMYDVGHPLSYTQAVIDTFLEGYTPAYKNGDYFIGVKK